MSVGARLGRWIGVGVVLALGVPEARAQQVILDGMTWMTQYPATWNAGAPKVVSDGLHSYAVLCGYFGSAANCSLARRRGSEPWQAHGHATFTSNQPPTMVIDRKGRLNVFFNDPYIHHFRFDRPSLNLIDWVNIPIPYGGGTGYLHASYDAIDDIIMLAFNETAAWGLKLAVKATDANNWMVSDLPPANPGTMLLYVRVLRAQGRYAVVAGEHVINASNATYTAAIMFESTGAAGPWTRRVVHQVYGDNLGVPYVNWVLLNDFQADASGRVRVLLHINENGSGHANPLDGLYILRQEDAYLPRLIGSDISDGFALYADPSGTHIVFAAYQYAEYHPGETTPFDYATDIATYRSGDNGATWSARRTEVTSALNPNTADRRNGSMLGGSQVGIIYSNEVTWLGPWDSVRSTGVALGDPQTADRYDFTYQDGDGTTDYVRAYRDAASGRFYYYVYDYKTDGSFGLTYSYRAGSYCQAYVATSAGAYRYFNSDGVQINNGNPPVVRYLGNDGIHTIHLQGMCGDPSRVNRVRIQKPGP